MLLTLRLTLFLLRTYLPSLKIRQIQDGVPAAIYIIVHGQAQLALMVSLRLAHIYIGCLNQLQSRQAYAALVVSIDPALISYDAC